MSDKVLVLRTCDKDLKSHGGFQWPESGEVSCDDWDPAPRCGGGLHGLPWGEGSGLLLDWSDSARWLVVEVVANEVVAIDAEKVKFPRGEVVYCGDRDSATKYILANGARGGAVVGATVTGGYRATVTGGYRATVTGGHHAMVTGGDDATVTGGDHATVTGGHRATVTGGDDATVTGGDYATVTGGDYATVTGGDYATVTGGHHATVTGGYRAMVTGGDDATVTGGDYATVTGGYRAMVTGGYRAMVTGGDDATVTGGYRATILISYWDHEKHRKRVVVGYVGEDGIKANTPYRLDSDHNFVAVEGDDDE